ncbi:unnamed protein product [Spirodela intermedia]|uniref:Rhodanese domain-containing protein n=1 Tax=Spirodela intermedia TaxID=51605 RepID=A0A7I8JKH5_SPIIN|nr:unnamed protein product [Spirodela intermedia]CAA6670648.1 unnamed protein product [Spirodela intermedia]
MAARVATVTRTPTPSSSSSSASSKVDVSPRTPRRLKAPTLPQPSAMVSATSVSLLALFSAPSSSFNEAKAFTFAREEILSSLTQVENALDKVEAATLKASEFIETIIKFVNDTLKPAGEVVLPVVTKAGEDAINVATPVVFSASDLAKEALLGAGIDPAPIISTFECCRSCQTIASSAVDTISSTDPAVLGASSGGLALAYLLSPPVLSAVSSNFRGYKGDLSPAQTLDLVSSQQYLLIDIRSEDDKAKAGVPRLPSSAKNQLISIPLEQLPSKTRNIVRDVKKAEADIAALKISYLKGVNKGSNIVIMDSYSDSAKIVAKTLTSLGFGNCWVIRLGSDSYDTSVVEVLSPSRIISAARSFGTTGSTQSSGNLLPGSVDS